MDQVGGAGAPTRLGNLIVWFCGRIKNRGWGDLTFLLDMIARDKEANVVDYVWYRNGSLDQ